MNARAEILERIGAALDPRPVSPAARVGYRREGTLSADERVELFAARVRDYQADLHHVAESEVAALIASLCSVHNARRLVVPSGLPNAWQSTALELVEDDHLSTGELDALDGAVTGCTVAVAETGTLLLAAGSAEGRRALSLVPTCTSAWFGSGRSWSSYLRRWRASRQPGSNGSRSPSFRAVGDVRHRVESRRRCARPAHPHRDRDQGGAMTERTAFVLQVRPDKVEEYVQAHREVWPEMLDALRGAGIRNYTIFRDGNRMFGYFEADDLAEAGRRMAAQPVSTRWQDAMANLLEERVPDESPSPLEEVFRLD